MCSVDKVRKQLSLFGEAQLDFELLEQYIQERLLLGVDEISKVEHQLLHRWMRRTNSKHCLVHVAGDAGLIHDALLLKERDCVGVS